MEKAMMTLPGASTFMDRQALAGHTSSGQQHSLFMKSPALSSMMDITVPSLKGITLASISTKSGPLGTNKPLSLQTLKN
jgi:hypothetical protein